MAGLLRRSWNRLFPRKHERKFLTLLTEQGACQVEVTHLDIKPGDTVYAIAVGSVDYTEMSVRADRGELFKRGLAAQERGR